MKFSSTVRRLAAVALAALIAAVATAGASAGTASAQPAAPSACPAPSCIAVGVLHHDADGDGIVDVNDKYPDTPATAAVNKDGCSDGCSPDQLKPHSPISGVAHSCAVLCDGDGDGVPNASDKCPGTAANATVDADGCSAAQKAPPPDADGDKVPDGADKCPATAPGATVDADGCSAAQKTPPDADGDKVPDSADKCPATAPGATVEHPVQPDVDVHVTVPDNDPGIVPTTTQPVIVNSPGPAAASGPAGTSGPPIINITLPNQPQTQAQPPVQVPVVHRQTHTVRKPIVRHRPRHHQRHRTVRHRRHTRHRA